MRGSGGDAEIRRSIVEGAERKMREEIITSTVFRGSLTNSAIFINSDQEREEKAAAKGDGQAARNVPARHKGQKSTQTSCNLEAFEGDQGRCPRKLGSGHAVSLKSPTVSHQG